MNRIKGFDGEEASELKAKLGNIEDLIAKSQRALKAKVIHFISKAAVNMLWSA